MRCILLLAFFLFLTMGCDSNGDSQGNNSVPTGDTQHSDSWSMDITEDTLSVIDACADLECDSLDTQNIQPDAISDQPDTLEGDDILKDDSQETSLDAITQDTAVGGEDTEADTADDPFNETDTEDVAEMEDTAEDTACTDEWDWLTLPVRVALLTSSQDNLTTTLTDADVADLLEHTNDVWEQACIRFEMESISTVAATPEGEEEYLGALANPVPGAMLAAMKVVMPEEELLAIGWNVVVIKTFGIPAAGVYSEETDTVFFTQGKYAAKPTHPTILAHELGHSLGLPHYNGPNVEFNLMHEGGSGDPETSVELTPEQILMARDVAESGDAH